MHYVFHRLRYLSTEMFTQISTNYQAKTNDTEVCG